MMKRADSPFNRMDAWRPLPSYRLDRRADLFFSLYFPEVLEVALRYPIENEILPEFPIHIGQFVRTIKQTNPSSMFVSVETEPVSPV